MTEALQQEIRTLRSLLNSDRDPDGRVFAPLADAYRRSGQLQEAVALLNDGLTRHPDFVPGHVVAAQLYVEQGLAEEGEIAARRALELDAENVNALQSLLRVLDGRGDLPEAEEVRSRLLALEPDAAPHGMKAAASLDEAALAGHEPVDRADTLEMPALAPEPEATLAEEEAFLAAPLEESSPTEADASEEAAVFDLDVLAPVEETEPEDDLLEPSAAAPDVTDEEGVVSLDAPPDTEQVTEEPVFELDALAPDTGEVTEEPVFDLDALAPATEPASAAEDVMELSALAPDAETASEEVVLDMSALAPDAETASEEVVLDMSALAPDVETASEEVVLDMSALAPDVETASEEVVLDMSALAPDVETASEEVVVDMDALAPAPEPTPPSGEPVVDVDALAPEPSPTEDERVVDLDTLAPEPEPQVQESSTEEPAIGRDVVAASAPSDEGEGVDFETPEAPEPAVDSEAEVEPGPAPDASEAEGSSPTHEEPGEPVYTRTLASLYETQGAVSEALSVLRRLRAADPDDEDLARRIGDLEARLESMDGGEVRVERESVEVVEEVEEAQEEEEVETLARDLAQSGEGEHDIDSPFAWGEQEAEEEPGTGSTVREYFEDLLSWEPDEE